METFLEYAFVSSLFIGPLMLAFVFLVLFSGAKKHNIDDDEAD